MMKTALNQIHRELGGKMVEFGGFEMPMQFSGIIKEHLAVRNGVGMFDVSHMGDLWIKGDDALDLMQYVQTNDASALRVGGMLYSHILDRDGHIKDDTIFGLYEENKFLAVPNASTTPTILKWYRDMAREKGFHVEIEDASERLSCIALQGPRSADVLSKLTDEDVSSMPSFTMKTLKIRGIEGDAIVSTTGYTGEKGFEIIVENRDAIPLWKALTVAGEEYGIQPCGLGARDTLRMEKGFLLSGQDFDEDQEKHTTLETGYGWIVKMNHDFVGRDVLEEQKARGIPVRFTGIVLEERGVPRHGCRIFSAEGEEIGHLTSGTMSPSLKKGIGLGYLKWGYHRKGTEVYVEIRGRKLKGTVSKPPLV